MHSNPSRSGRYEAEKTVCPGNPGIEGPIAQPPYVTVARILRTRGNRGEVLVELYTDFPARFDHLKEVYLKSVDHRREKVTIENLWNHSGRLVFKFEGIDTISAAEQIVGCWLEVDGEDTVELPVGMYFDHDLIGCEVRDGEGRPLGRVEEILHIPSNDQLVVRGEQAEYLIPAAGSICREICIADKRIVVDLPEGLLELNQ